MNLDKEISCPRCEGVDIAISLKRKSGRLFGWCNTCQRLFEVPKTFWNGVKIQDAFLEKTQTK